MSVAGMIEGWAHRMKALAARRPADFLIGPPDDPYLRRWFVIPRNRLFNIYLHQFRHSDDDRALHDHPWVNCSILLTGSYTEHTIRAGGVHVRRRYSAGAVKLRLPGAAHRIEMTDGECWTLFLTGPVVRRWGFHCPQGWRHWQDFADKRNRGDVGRGCAD